MISLKTTVLSAKQCQRGKCVKRYEIRAFLEDDFRGTKVFALRSLCGGLARLPPDHNRFVSIPDSIYEHLPLRGIEMFHQRGNRSSRHLLILRTRPSQMSWISVDFAVDFLVKERVLSTRKSYAFPNDL